MDDVKVISVRQLQEEIDVALWELQVGQEPENVVMTLLYRMRRTCQPRRAGIIFRLWMSVCERRGWR